MTAQGDTNTLTLVVTMTMKPEAEAAFLAQARDFIATVEAEEPGTILYVLTKHPEREHTYVWVERYRDLAAAEAHRNSPYMAETMPKIREWLAAPPEFLRLRQVLPE
ncbi:MAG TPA: putative quinol monooxygenase [Dehalococcoidia bacterium]|nr:putative quinol monooxygenase [Dehalococcoidia bacterium]